MPQQLEMATPTMTTTVLQVDVDKIGEFRFVNPKKRSFLGEWSLELSKNEDAKSLSLAASHLRTTSIPVAFPTETVYGLGADATSSDAVRGIFRAKQRPSDNPLIVHICCLSQLQKLAAPGSVEQEIPPIYTPLIERFWPGPLTILLPVPAHSMLAPEVSAGLRTFGVRMPDSLLALALIKLADRPLAAPSANASTRPSPTTAQHVAHDLDGRINLILDGGPCNVGVESTVVDGLSSPPAILRPGGVSIEQIREFPGWEDVTVGYKDRAFQGDAPRAPGMKYKHYSPKARVVLVEWNSRKFAPSEAMVGNEAGKMGVVRTRQWTREVLRHDKHTGVPDDGMHTNGVTNGQPVHNKSPELHVHEYTLSGKSGKPVQDVYEVNIGPDTASIARNLFSALRLLDSHSVESILVEGIDGDAGDGAAAAAVMNRLRKAAQEVIS